MIAEHCPVGRARLLVDIDMGDLSAEFFYILRSLRSRAMSMWLATCAVIASEFQADELGVLSDYGCFVITQSDSKILVVCAGVSRAMSGQASH